MRSSSTIIHPCRPAVGAERSSEVARASAPVSDCGGRPELRAVEHRQIDATVHRRRSGPPHGGTPDPKYRQDLCLRNASVRARQHVRPIERTRKTNALAANLVDHRPILVGQVQFRLAQENAFMYRLTISEVHSCFVICVSAHSICLNSLAVGNPRSTRPLPPCVSSDCLPSSPPTLATGGGAQYPAEYRCEPSLARLPTCVTNSSTDGPKALPPPAASPACCTRDIALIE